MTDAATTPASTSEPAPAAASNAQPNQAAAPSSTATTPVAGAPAAAATSVSEPVYDLKAPQGFDPSGLARVVEVAKLYGIAPEKAQKLLDDTHANQIKAKADTDAALAKQKSEWHAEIQSDKEIGGEQFKATMERAQKVINEIDQKIAPGIKKLLDDSGYGDEPRVVRLFAYLGRANREDSFATSDRSGNDSSPKSLAQLFYPKG